MPALPAGYEVTRFEDRRVAVVALVHQAYGPNADTASDTVDGLLYDIITATAQGCDESGFKAYNAHLYKTSVGLQLDNIIAPLFGTKRQKKTASIAQVIVYGKSGFPVLTGSNISTLDRGDVFSTDATVTIDTSATAVFRYGPAAILTTTSLKVNGMEYSPLAPISGTGVQIAEHAISILVFDTNIQSISQVWEDVNGNGCVVVEMTNPWAIQAASSAGDSDAFYGVKVLATSEEKAPINGEALTIARINSPQSGWEGVVNPESATLGTNEATDGQYRAKHALTLGSPGSATPMGLQGKYYKLKGVEAVRAYFNFTGADPDAFGRPSHSWEYVIVGGSDADIAITGWIDHTTGTQSYGNTSAVVIDSRDGTPRTMKWSRANELFVWIDMQITAGEGFPTTPIQDLKVEVSDRILIYGQALMVGKDAYLETMKQQVQLSGCELISIQISTTLTAVGPKPPLIAADLIIGQIEISRWALERIVVEFV